MQGCSPLRILPRPSFRFPRIITTCRGVHFHERSEQVIFLSDICCPAVPEDIVAFSNFRSCGRTASLNSLNLDSDLTLFGSRELLLKELQNDAEPR